MTKGFLKAILYYILVLGIAGVFYLTVERSYIHAPTFIISLSFLHSW